MKYLFAALIFTLTLDACNNVQSNPQSSVRSPESSDHSPQSASSQMAQQGNFTIGYLMGKFDPAQHPDFVAVDAKYTDGDPYFLRKETYASFQKMWKAAKADGINLTIISATRNFNRQKQIWEAKWTGARRIENGTNATQKYPDPKTRALKI
ncbi:MAG: D-alanyl-D-alanine carboxypeptidase family protein, partial [Saprospiraceae bacterium]